MKRALIHWLRRILILLLVTLVALMGMIFFFQHSLIYHPRPYDSSYARALPANGIEIEYQLPAGGQVAYFLPGTMPIPSRLWLAFCGNGALALDWAAVLRGYPPNGDAFLLVDYPGYGRNTGYATIASTRDSAEAAWHTLARRLGVAPDRLRLCVIGHSLGAAAALDFSACHRVERVVAISPFTTLREEGALLVGGPLSYLLTENYDNRARLAEIFRLNPEVNVAVFHGTEDEVIPFRMGRDLAQKFPSIEFVAVTGAGHNSVLDFAEDKIFAAMTSGN